MKNSDPEKAFIQLIRQNERVIYKVCSFYVSEEFPMADLYQEVVCNLWMAYPKFRGECSLSTWIYRIALNTCISGMRKAKRRSQSTSLAELHDILPGPDDMIEEIREMYRLIYRLKPLDRAIVLLWLEERSYQEIANVAGLTVNNVAIRLKRAKDKLKLMSEE